MKVRVINTLAVFWQSLLVALVLASCGAGDDGMFQTPEPAVGEGGVGGFWVGEFVSDPDQPEPRGRTMVTAMTTDQGRAQFIFEFAAGTHVSGLVSTSVDEVAGELACYLGGAIPFIGTDGLEPMVLTGTITPRGAWGGSYKTESDFGRFLLQYSEAYENPSSLDSVTGLYSFDVSGVSGMAYSLTLEVDETGTVFGQDTTGCVYSGSISVIDPRYSMYDVELLVALCGMMDGRYLGLASLQPSYPVGSQLLYLAASAEETALAVPLNGPSR